LILANFGDGFALVEEKFTLLLLEALHKQKNTEVAQKWVTFSVVF
jgi:hypothetical protein